MQAVCWAGSTKLLQDDPQPFTQASMLKSADASVLAKAITSRATLAWPILLDGYEVNPPR